MSNRVRTTISRILLLLKKYEILAVFLFIVFMMTIAGVIYTMSLTPNSKSVNTVINNFSMNEYSLPYYMAERYVIWRNMRTFFTVLHYSLTLLGVVASLVTVFFASTSKNNNDNKNNSKIVFLSLLATCCTIGSIFVYPEGQASTSQHAWRELDSCIIHTLNNNSLTIDEKNKIIADKIVEMEKYIETNERL